MFAQLVAPPVEPVTLEQVKRQARIDIDDDDEHISSLIIPAARDRAEQYLRRYLVQQNRRMVLDDFPFEGRSPQQAGWRIVIPLGSISSILAIRYRDIDDETVVIDPADYRADLINEPARIEMKRSSWPSTLNALSAVEVDFTCGYAATAGSPVDYRANIPPAVRMAILMDCAHLYDNRSATQDGLAITAMPHGWEDLLFPYRMLQG